MSGMLRARGQAAREAVFTAVSTLKRWLRGCSTSGVKSRPWPLWCDGLGYDDRYAAALAELERRDYLASEYLKEKEREEKG